MSKKPNRIARIKKYLQYEVWQIRLVNLPRSKTLQIKILRILLLIGQKFQKDNLAHAASAMTFFTLLSIVPVIAMLFGITKAFISHEEIERELQNSFQGQEQIIEQLIKFANAMLNTQGGLIAGVGFLTLAYSIYKLLNNIEVVFNGIWAIEKPRSIIQKVTDYLTLIILAPVMMVLVQALNIVGVKINQIASEYEITPEITSLISFLTSLFPYIFLWLLFTLLYMVMPNTKVNLKNAFIGGVIGGSAYQLMQWVYFKFQIGVSGANAVYGSFAALPLFLAQLQLGWMIILFGCTLTYAIQNVHRFERYSPEHRVSQAENKQFIVLVLHEITQHFKTKNLPLTILEIAEKTDIPIRHIELLIEQLLEAQILTEVEIDTKNANGYQPAMDTDNFTLYFIQNIVETFGDEPLQITESQPYLKLHQLARQTQQEAEKSTHNMLLKDI